MFRTFKMLQTSGNGSLDRSHVTSLDILRHDLTPSYVTLFQSIFKIPDGIRFLVNLRADLLVRPSVYSFISSCSFDRLNLSCQESSSSIKTNSTKSCIRKSDAWHDFSIRIWLFLPFFPHSLIGFFDVSLQLLILKSLYWTWTKPSYMCWCSSSLGNHCS